MMDEKTLGKTLAYVFKPKEREKILVISDYEKQKLGKKFFRAFRTLSENVFFLVMPPLGQHGEEPESLVAEAMKNCDVFLAITKYSLTHTRARIYATKVKKARGATLPNFVPKMLPSLLENPLEMRKLGLKLKRVLSEGRKALVKAKNGTQIEFSIEDRVIDIDEGLYDRKGSFGNLPAGEVCLAPKEGTANGTIVIDSMKDGKEVYARKGTKIKVKNGMAIEIDDKKSKLARFFEKVENARNLAEFGIGINRKAKLIGYILQDEKVYGTCHFAFGDNLGLGGKIKSEIHLDGIIVKPDIWIDGKLIMKEGRVLI